MTAFVTTFATTFVTTLLLPNDDGYMAVTWRLHGGYQYLVARCVQIGDPRHAVALEHERARAPLPLHEDADRPPAITRRLRGGYKGGYKGGSTLPSTRMLIVRLRLRGGYEAVPHYLRR